LALIAIALFGAIVLALFSYVYFSTASYVRSRSDNAIRAEQVSLQKAYDRAGRDGLIKSSESPTNIFRTAFICLPILHFPLSQGT
jgi:hypothetical protein